MKNIYGVEINKKDIDKTIKIAIDLQFYGYNYIYFHENYASLLNKDDSKKIWKMALKRNIEDW